MQDYPIYASVPETGFSCAGPGRVAGGYYADTEAECQGSCDWLSRVLTSDWLQPFHVCTADANTGGLVPFSFLCPNGTLFNQESIQFMSSYVTEECRKDLGLSWHF